MLILVRVISLWERNKLAARWMYTGFLVSFLATLGFATTTLVILNDDIHFVAEINMCAPTGTTFSLVAVWAAPMLFEVIVLISTAWNFLLRPRTTNVRLARALHRDGITFFVILTLLRALNLTLAALRQPALSLLAVFFVWAAETVTLNRSLLHVRRVEDREARNSISQSIDMRVMTNARGHARHTSSALSTYVDKWNEEHAWRLPVIGYHKPLASWTKDWYLAGSV